MTGKRLSDLFQLLLRPRVVLAVWILASLGVVVMQYVIGTNREINNFLIFTNSFHHLSEGLNLYQAYPAEHFDYYLYGPAFALLMAPFALLPLYVSYPLWTLLNALLLYYAVYRLPLPERSRSMIAWIVLNSLITALMNSQFHAICTALILLSYSGIHEKRYFWAAFFLVLGVFIKLYGIVALAFFFFMEDKVKYAAYLLFWAAVLFALPMIFTGFDYTIRCYGDWYQALLNKNAVSVDPSNTRTDVCVMGMVRRIFQAPYLSNLWFIIPGLIIFFSAYLNTPKYNEVPFQLRLLASALLFIILASTGSESPTLLIGFTGVAIWFMLSRRRWYDHLLLWFALAVSSFSPTDLFPAYIREQFIIPYALMALPLLLVWLKLSLELTGDSPVFGKRRDAGGCSL